MFGLGVGTPNCLLSQRADSCIQTHEWRATHRTQFSVGCAPKECACAALAAPVLTVSSFWLLLAVGNIPYDVTEQELTDIFSEVGPIKSMR